MDSSENVKKATPRVVLVTRLSALGDVALTVPALYPVCRANPDVRFVMLTQPWPATMMVGAPSNLTVVPVDVRNEYKGLRGMWRLAAKLRGEYGIDAVADLHSVMRSWAIDLRMRLAGVRVVRIDKGRGEKRDRIKGRRHDRLKSTMERYRDVFARLGLNMPPADAFTSVLDGATLEPSAIVPAKGDGERWIAVAPFSQHRSKEYPLERMEKVIDSLAALPGVHIFLMGGGKQEKLALRPIARRIKNATSLAEYKHTLADELQLMARCDVMVTMDSANMHLASLVGLPAVSVWGATHPDCGFLGYGQSEANIVQRDDLACRPCGVFGENKCRYGDYRCLDIAPEVIVERVTRLLKSLAD